MAKRISRRFPDLRRLHERHYGLTPSLCGAYAEAATVCLARHHLPPTMWEVSAADGGARHELEWTLPGDREAAAWNNADDATRDGAYAVSIGATEVHLGLFAVGRAETRTGADYYVAEAREVRDLERAHRLEVSGVDAADVSRVRSRLRAKVAQARAGASDLPAIAAVVGFGAACVMLEPVED